MVNKSDGQVARDMPLQDWRGVKPHVQFPQYLRWRSSSLLPQRLASYFIVGRLELGCYIAAAFLRAHRQAQCQLRDFIGTVGNSLEHFALLSFENVSNKCFRFVNRIYKPILAEILTCGLRACDNSVRTYGTSM